MTRSQKIPGRGTERAAHSPRAPKSAARAAALGLPVLPGDGVRIRRSRMSRRRAAVLIAVHILILAHIAHWLIRGETISPIEPSEAMYTLNEGHLNAGFIFFAVAILATLLLGRFVCGWGCHLVAYQDLCAWLLKKMHIKVRPLRSRLLVLAPLSLALYMFVWPSAYRWWVGAPAPRVSNHLTTSEFWVTFPGPVVAVLTIAVCGFVIIYFLGSKGFCTYACPYGGLFRVADRFAVGSIRVTDACKHCGHCTSVCTSNVRVHEEVALYGMVVDPGCMKCMDCVSVCPNDALYYGFGPPTTAVGLRNRLQRLWNSPHKNQPEPQFSDCTIAPKASSNRLSSRKTHYDLPLSGEIILVVIGVAALLVYRGLYDQIPLLLAMAMAGLTAFIALKFYKLLRSANVRLQNLQLKRGGQWTRAGIVFASLVVLLFVWTGHSAAVQFNAWRGRMLFRSLPIGDEVWSADQSWWQNASPKQRADAERAIAYLQRADQWGLLATPSVLSDLVWLYLSADCNDDAERAVRRLVKHWPHRPDPHRGLANVMRKQRHLAEAEEAYHRALSIDPTFEPARKELGGLLASMNRFDEAAAVFLDAIELAPDDPQWRLALAGVRMAAGNFDDAIEQLARVVEKFPDNVEGHYNLGYALLAQGRASEAVAHLSRAVELAPHVALYHHNLAVAIFMTGRPADALPHAREAARLDPDDPAARGFLSVVLSELAE